MLDIFCFIGIILINLTFLSNCDPLNGDNGWYPHELAVENYVHGGIVPKPRSQELTGTRYTLLPDRFRFHITGEQSDVLEMAVKRYVGLTFPDQKVQTKQITKQLITSLDIIVRKPYEKQSLASNESYTLTIKAPQSTLYAYEVWGALRGLETFSQLVYQDEDNLYYADENKIIDYPRFHHRAFMIDTSRHYLRLSVILKFLDAMSYAKFNVLHWHIVDDQSFPFVSQAFPSLSGQGAYYNKTHIYTDDAIMQVLEYARLRGIRVIPEFDTPGHTNSWRSIKNLLTVCCDKNGKPTGSLGPIDPTIDSNYVFLKAFFDEVAGRFPDAYLHLGGDEVNFDCWKSNPNITMWMQEHGMGANYALLEQYYEQKLLNIVGSLKKDYIIWQEVIDNKVKVNPDTVVNVWKGGWQGELAKVTGLGLKTILSSCWYLNYVSYGNGWQKYYQCEPTDFTGSDAAKELVIGGTGCMWGEWVDGTNLLPRTWPRALAVAERLWSSKETTDLGDAGKRIWEHRCRYLRRGIPAENAIQSKYCRHEWGV